MEDDESSVSVCALHPGVAVTGFCPACLRDRLAGLHPPSADLRRCKSFSYYARSSSSSASYLQVQEEQPHRRSCDARQHPPPVPEDIIGRPIKDHITHQHESSSSSTTTKAAFGSLGKRWQEWRRKTKLKKQQPESAAATTTTTTRPTMPLPPESPSGALGRRSCDAFSSRGMLGVDEPRASCDGVSWAPPPSMLFVPRSDDQIPVEEEEEEAYVPGGSAQTRDYYLDSSSYSRRRRSVDRKSFSSDAGEQLPSSMVAAAANARVSPAVVGTEFYHHHHPQPHAFQYHQPSFEPPPFLGREEATATTKSKPKNKGIKGWSIWGLLHKKSSSNSVGASAFGGEARAAAPELRARGYDGQMLRCNSSVSARSSFSGINGGLGGRMRRADEVLLARNFSARYSSSSSCSYQNQYQFHKGDKDYSNSIANNSGAGRPPPPPRSSASSSLPRSSLGLYYY